MAIKKKVPRKSNDKDFQKVVDRVNEQDMSTPNDIPVSEDGVIYDEPLLAGYIDDSGLLHETFAYREMDGSDEEEINKPEIRNNAGKIVNTICERCVIAIGDIKKKEVDKKTWSSIIRSLYLYDLEYIMFKIRELSKGNVMTFKHKCPNCKSQVVTEVGLDEFDIIPFSGQHEIPFELRRGVKDRFGNYHKYGNVRIMNGYDAELVLPQYKKNEAVAKTLLMSRLMTFEDEGDGFALDSRMVRNMTSYDRNKIEEILQDCVFGVSLNTTIICPSCGEDFEISAGSSDFI